MRRRTNKGVGEAVLAVCPLAHPEGCRWCGRKLTGRQSMWCSRKCSRAFAANHRWTQAKAEAKKDATWFMCANAEFGNTPWELLGPSGCEGFTRKPEVNHLEPILGKHGTFGCHHHQSNLEVLCRPCHLAATAKQRSEGKFS